MYAKHSTKVWMTLNEFIRPSTQSLYLAVSFIPRLYTATKGVNRQNVIIQLVSINNNIDKINTNCLFLLNIITVFYDLTTNPKLEKKPEAPSILLEFIFVT